MASDFLSAVAKQFMAQSRAPFSMLAELGGVTGARAEQERLEREAQVSLQEYPWLVQQIAGGLSQVPAAAVTVGLGRLKPALGLIAPAALGAGGGYSEARRRGFEPIESIPSALVGGTVEAGLTPFELNGRGILGFTGRSMLAEPAEEVVGEAGQALVQRRPVELEALPERMAGAAVQSAVTGGVMAPVIPAITAPSELGEPSRTRFREFWKRRFSQEAEKLTPGQSIVYDLEERKNVSAQGEIADAVEPVTDVADYVERKSLLLSQPKMKVGIGRNEDGGLEAYLIRKKERAPPDPASVEALESNLPWLREAWEKHRDVAADWADLSALDPLIGREGRDLFAQVLAVSKPFATPRDNIRYATAYFMRAVRGEPIQDFGQEYFNSVKGNLGRVIEGQPPSSPEVLNYWALLMGDTRAVPIDAKLGYYLGVNDIPKVGEDLRTAWGSIKERNFDYAHERIRRLADEMGVPPADLVSAGWAQINEDLGGGAMKPLSDLVLDEFSKEAFKRGQTLDEFSEGFKRGDYGLPLAKDLSASSVMVNLGEPSGENEFAKRRTLNEFAKRRTLFAPRRMIATHQVLPPSETGFEVPWPIIQREAVRAEIEPQRGEAFRARVPETQPSGWLNDEGVEVLGQKLPPIRIQEEPQVRKWVGAKFRSLSDLATLASYLGDSRVESTIHVFGKRTDVPGLFEVIEADVITDELPYLVDLVGPEVFEDASDWQAFQNLPEYEKIVLSKRLATSPQARQRLTAGIQAIPRKAAKLGADTYTFIHNHPGAFETLPSGGDPLREGGDIEVASFLRTLFKKDAPKTSFQDPLIITNGGFVVFRPHAIERFAEFYENPYGYKSEIWNRTPYVDHPLIGEEAVRAKDDTWLMDLGMQLPEFENEVYLVYRTVDTPYLPREKSTGFSNRISAIEKIPFARLREPDWMTRYVRKKIIEHSSFMPDTVYKPVSMTDAWVSWLAKDLREWQIPADPKEIRNSPTYAKYLKNQRVRDILEDHPAKAIAAAQKLNKQIEDFRIAMYLYRGRPYQPINYGLVHPGGLFGPLTKIYIGPSTQTSYERLRRVQGAGVGDILKVKQLPPPPPTPEEKALESAFEKWSEEH